MVNTVHSYLLFSVHFSLAVTAAKEVIRFGFDELHLAAISAYCFPFNQRSKNILKKYNFEYEGTLKMAEKLFNGNINDNDCFLLAAPRYYRK